MFERLSPKFECLVPSVDLCMQLEKLGIHHMDTEYYWVLYEDDIDGDNREDYGIHRDYTTDIRNAFRLVHRNFIEHDRVVCAYEAPTLDVLICHLLYVLMERSDFVREVIGLLTNKVAEQLIEIKKKEADDE